MPFNSLSAEMELRDGAVSLHPLRLGVGRGGIEGTIRLTPRDGGAMTANADVQFRQLDLSQLMRVTGDYQGAGSINGRARIEGTGNSFAAILGNGNGGATLAMSGGNLSALLVDLSGLRLGSAVLSALGVPGRTGVQCFVADLGLTRGVAQARTVLVDTESVLIGVEGQVNLAREALDLRIRSESKEFTIGALPTDIRVRGTFRNPDIGVDTEELLARGGAAGVLGLLVAPVAALLPTIQFGIGEDNRCENLVRGGGRRATRGGTEARPR